MKKTMWFILASLLIIGGIYYYITYINIGSVNKDVPIFGVTQVIIENAKIEEGNKDKTIDITYPKTNLTFVDQDIDSLIKSILEEFKTTTETKPDCVDCPDWQNTLFVNYDVIYNNDGVLSLKFNTEIFTGGAHPSHLITTKNYDLKDKKIIEFEDIIKNQDVLDSVAKLSLEYFKHQKLEYDLFIDGFEAKKENYVNFNMKKDSVIFYFQEYQIAPYVAGSQEVELKLTDLNI